MIEELHEVIRQQRSDYFNLGQELGQIINDQQDIILSLQRENKRLRKENFNLRKTKRRKR